MATPAAKNIKYYEAVGRRKEAVARVRLYIAAKDKTAVIGGKKYDQGVIIINEMPAQDYILGMANKARYTRPFQLTETTGRFITYIKVNGGGTTGQLEAIMLAVSRALQDAESTLRPILKSALLLRRDPRIRERRKVGTGGKARRAKQSPKR